MIRKEEKDGILTIILDRPKALNAINTDIMDSLHTIFVDEADDTIDKYYAIIITGEGSKAFAAGADIKEFPNFDVSQGEALSQKGHQTYNAIEHFPVPVIAVANGFALGGGCELMMACHMIIAEEHAKFGQPEINLGLVPGYGGSQRLIRLVGRVKAIELLLTGDMIDSQEALKLGMVNHVEASGEGRAKAEKIAHKIKSKSPVVVSKLLKLMHAYQDYEVSFDEESKVFGECFGLEDMKEGVAAFMEKRKATFSRKS